MRSSRLKHAWMELFAASADVNSSCARGLRAEHVFDISPKGLPTATPPPPLAPMLPGRVDAREVQESGCSCCGAGLQGFQGHPPSSCLLDAAVWQGAFLPDAMQQLECFQVLALILCHCAKERSFNVQALTLCRLHTLSQEISSCRDEATSALKRAVAQPWPQTGNFATTSSRRGSKRLPTSFGGAPIQRQHRLRFH